jgi:hypothetical protein
VLGTGLSEKIPFRDTAAGQRANMRIKDVKAWWVRIPIEASRQHRSDFGQVRTFDAAILRIETDDGIVGWGEGKNAAGSAGTYGALVHMLNHEIGPGLIGRDAADISTIWEMLYNGVRHQTAAAGRGDQRRRHRTLGHSRQIARRSGVEAAGRPQGRKNAGLCLRRLGKCRTDRRPIEVVHFHRWLQGGEDAGRRHGRRSSSLRRARPCRA